jgi:hypothetical protein
METKLVIVLHKDPCISPMLTSWSSVIKQDDSCFTSTYILVGVLNTHQICCNYNVFLQFFSKNQCNFIRFHSAILLGFMNSIDAAVVLITARTLLLNTPCSLFVSVGVEGYHPTNLAIWGIITRVCPTYLLFHSAASWFSVHWHSWYFHYTKWQQQTWLLNSVFVKFYSLSRKTWILLRNGGYRHSTMHSYYACAQQLDIKFPG